MNHVPMKMTASAPAPPARMTRRALAKQRTREKILASARALFAERGYDGATIRDIARAAGLSTGAVFASFTDKAELFGDILAADHAALAAAMRDADRPDAEADEALRALFGAAFCFHFAQLQLTRAGLAVSWAHDIEAERRGREALRPVIGLVRQAVERGVRTGRFKASADPDLVARMLWDLHLACLRGAIFEGRPLADVSARFGDRLEMLMAGVRA